MLRSRFLVLSMAAAWLASLPALATTVATKQSRPDVRSNVALVIDADSDTVLFARNANATRPIASLTKLMTALIVLESGQSLTEEIAIAREDRDGTQGSASRLPVGAAVTRGDLLRLALMASDNRAAYALARSYPGGKDAALRAMNARARSAGMTNTKFDDPSGLSPNNVATATDISKLMAEAAKQPLIREYSIGRHYSLTVAKRAVDFRNTNYLVTKADWNIELQKTGYTSEAGQCLAMKTVIQRRNLIIVLLDSFGKYTRTADARRIRTWLESQGAGQLVSASR